MDRILFLESKEDPKRTPPKVLVAAGVPEISVSTVQRGLREKGLYGRVAAHKPYVPKTNMEKRGKFTREHLQWTTGLEESQKFRKPDDLFDAVSQELAVLPLQTLETLVESKPR
uniref:Transposase Tc1-like domain-containing protein n=1 Tax=Plectus sambesii TaxID=2011161 RepID=A0A914WBV4_9BILA